jgi:hypothetical protein
MKFLSSRVLILVVVSSSFLVSVTSCKKSNSGGSNSVAASVGGTAWASNVTVIGIYSTQVGLGVFDIGAFQVKGKDSTTFSLTFTTPFAVNKSFSSDTTNLDISYQDINGLPFDASAGLGHSLMTITSYDSTGHRIAGTFSGVLYDPNNDSLVVTGGTFNTSLLAQ